MAHADEPARARLLGDDEGAVGGAFQDREAHLVEGSDLAPVGEVAARRLGSALDDVPGHDAGGQPIEVGPAPVEGGHQRAERDAGVGDASADDDVGLETQRLAHRQRAEVGVGRHEALGNRIDGLARLHVAEVDAGGAQLGDAQEDVVAQHDGDAQLEALAAGGGQQRLGAAAGVDSAGVGHDARAPPLELAEQRLDLTQEVARPSGRRVLGSLLLQDAHRQLGQEVDRDVVEPGRAEQLATQGEGIVAPEPARVADAHDAGAGPLLGRATSSAGACCGSAGCHPGRLPRHMRRTPTCVLSIGALSVTARLWASTERVRRMSMTPSSQSRAEA